MMSNMTSESEDIITSNDCINSPTLDEVGTERNVVGSGPLKKGPWTSAEDAILVDYVNKHGEGNWNAVQKHSGLSRCGKSCRLRWANHLRPDLKKGAFTPEEEHRIIELHAKMGNKWARMAVELPGRTDNEIKNFWNTRTKRRQRAGLPIYPPDICLQALNNEDSQDQNMVTFGNGDTSHGEISPNNAFHIPAVEFKNLELNQELFQSNILDMPGSNLLDIPGGSLLPQGLNSTYNNNFLFPMANPPPKRVRRSDTYPGCGDVFPSVDQYEDDKIGPSFDFSSQNLNNNDDITSSCLFAGSHAFINGNTSSSDPMSWAMKMELPSLQYSTQLGSSCGAPSSPLPSLESVDTLMQCTNLIDEHTTKSDSPSPRDSGLLEAVLYEARNLNLSKSNNNNNLDIRHDSSSQNLQGEEDWEAYGGPISPLGHSAASVFSEYTPISGSSLDEHQSVDTISVKREAEEPIVKQSEREDELLHSRPDFLLGSTWFASNERNNDHISGLLGDDFCTDSRVSPHDDQSGKWDDICRVTDNR